jgi:Cadherin-like beta sandwich domain
VSTSFASVVIPGATPAIELSVSTYIGPQTIRIGQLTGCTVTQAGLECTGGTLFSIVPGGEDIDTLVIAVTPFAPPTIAMSFGAASIPLNGSTSLSFTISNPNTTSTLTGVGVTDTLPAGLVVSTPNGLTGSCGGGTLSATAGSGSVSLAGATLAESASCTFGVNVTGNTTGTKTNAAAATSVEGGSGLTASASLAVTTPNDANLSALTVSSGDASPDFAPGTLSYTDTVTNCVGSIKVTPTLEDPAASVKVNGVTVTSGTPTPISLAVGGNAINAVVTAHDGTTTQTYALAVTREAPGTNAPILQSAVSRRVHGSAGTFDLPLSLVPTNPTTEPRKGPGQSIVFTFDKAVNSALATPSEGNTTVAAPSFSGKDVIVPLPGVTDRQYVTLNLDSVSSTDGGSGGCGVVRVGFLVGDVSQNRVVTVSDLAQVNAQLAQIVTPANFLKDVNASGTLSVADRAITNANLTRNLPAP